VSVCFEHKCRCASGPWLRSQGWWRGCECAGAQAPLCIRTLATQSGMVAWARVRWSTSAAAQSTTSHRLSVQSYKQAYSCLQVAGTRENDRRAWTSRDGGKIRAGQKQKKVDGIFGPQQVNQSRAGMLQCRCTTAQPQGCPQQVLCGTVTDPVCLHVQRTA